MGPRATEAIAPAVVVLFAVLHALALAADRPRPPPPSACAYAVTIDGALVCDDAAPRSLGELCEGRDEPLASGDAIDRARVCAGDLGGRTRMDPDALARLGIAVDVNRASAEELESLPGIGPAIAARVIEGRPYASVDELERVKGIGPKTLAKLRLRARVD